MPAGRRLFFLPLAGLSAAGAAWVLAAAIRAGSLSGQVLFAMLPLAMLFAIAWAKLTHRDD